LSVFHLLLDDGSTCVCGREPATGYINLHVKNKKGKREKV
jgi:hypothetical protein